MAIRVWHVPVRLVRALITVVLWPPEPSSRLDAQDLHPLHRMQIR